MGSRAQLSAKSNILFFSVTSCMARTDAELMEPMMIFTLSLKTAL